MKVKIHKPLSVNGFRLLPGETVDVSIFVAEEGLALGRMSLLSEDLAGIEREIEMRLSLPDIQPYERWALHNLGCRVRAAKELAGLRTVSEFCRKESAT